MRGVVKNYVFGQNKNDFNTIIGGIGGTITTKSALATKLGISESIIKNFQIVGSDVHFKAMSNYSIAANAFEFDSSFKSCYDFDGLLLSIGNSCFKDSDVENLLIENADLGVNSLSGCTKLDNSNLGGEFRTNKTSLIAGFRDCRFPILNAPNLTSIPTSFVINNSYLTTVIWSVTNLPTDCLRSTPNLSTISNLSQITTINSGAIYQSGLTGSLYFDSVTSLVGPIREMPCTEVYFEILSTIVDKSNHFRQLPNIELISIKALKTFGDPASVSSAFSGIKLNCLIQANIALATTNSGGPDAALVWAKTNRSAVVEFYDDDGNYVSTL